MFRRIIAAAAILLLLAGCGVTKGEIIDKSHSPARSYVVLQSHYSPVAKTVIQIPVQQYIPEKWQFKLKNNEEIGWVSVPRENYDKFNIGDYYSIH